MAYIGRSPSPFHAVAEAAARLTAEGFAAVDERLGWPQAPGRHMVIRDGSLVAWSTENTTPSNGFRIIGAHSDSPNLRIRPRPDRRSAGLAQLAIEVYGSPLLNSWLDRDLGLSGRVVISHEGSSPSVHLIAIDEPLLRIPQLAIHLDRSITSEGLRLNPQTDLTPIWGIDSDLDLVIHLAERLGAEPTSVVSWELMTHDLTAPAILGADRALLAAPRIDNLLSCHAAVAALLEHSASVTDADGPVPVICMFDHEEVGSESASGAAGSMLGTILERISIAAALDRDEHHRALARSLCISADGAHATHPNRPERHEPGHQVALGAGPVLKYNESRRYATDPIGAAIVTEAARQIDMPLQQFSSRGDMPCGSTIGPLTAARSGIRTVDLGVAQLSMHSARELCAVADPPQLRRLLTQVLRTREDMGR
jgi:aspartyl aminopeptidase